MLKDLDQQQRNTDAPSVDINSASNNQYSIHGDDQLGVSKTGRGKMWSVSLGFLVFISVLGVYYFWQDKPVETVPTVKTNFDDVLFAAVDPSDDIKKVSADNLNSAKHQDSVGQGGSDKDNVKTSILEKGVVERATADSNNSLAVSAAQSINEKALENTRNKNQVVELIEIPEKPVVDKNIDTHINNLLEAANTAFTAERLTTPKSDNAYDRYTAILALQPNHLEAQQGLEKIQLRYLGFVKSVILKRHYYKVPDLVHRARGVGVSQESIDQLLSSLPSGTAQPARDVMKKTKQDVSVVNEGAGKGQAAVNKDSEKPELQVERSFSSIDAEVAKTAAKNIKNNRLLLAENTLKNFISENPKAYYSFQRLFNLYLSQQRLSDAENLIAKGKHLPGEWFSYMVGQILARRADYTGAMRALNSHSPEMYEITGYYALKAGLLHKLNEDQQAVDIYRQLLALDNRNPNYWLGLSVALDALKSTETASAYKQVLTIAPANAAYIEYVQRRVTELTQPLVEQGN
jgi:tetratricopeptide (TPR) repeat protein